VLLVLLRFVVPVISPTFLFKSILLVCNGDERAASGCR
jgi:hypothetical protein